MRDNSRAEGCLVAHANLVMAAREARLDRVGRNAERRVSPAMLKPPAINAATRVSPVIDSSLPDQINAASSRLTHLGELPGCFCRGGRACTPVTSRDPAVGSPRRKADNNQTGDQDNVTHIGSARPSAVGLAILFGNVLLVERQAGIRLGKSGH
jgi:hypothetical protein